MLRFRGTAAVVFGALAGVGAAVLLVSLSVKRAPRERSLVEGRLLDEATGPIEELAFHCVRCAGR